MKYTGMQEMKRLIKDNEIMRKKVAINIIRDIQLEEYRK